MESCRNECTIWLLTLYIDMILDLLGTGNNRPGWDVEEPWWQFWFRYDLFHYWSTARDWYGKPKVLLPYTGLNLSFQAQNGALNMSWCKHMDTAMWLLFLDGRVICKWCLLAFIWASLLKQLVVWHINCSRCVEAFFCRFGLEVSGVTSWVFWMMLTECGFWKWLESCVLVWW